MKIFVVIQHIKIVDLYLAKKELELRKTAIKQQIARKREELAKRKEIIAAGQHLLQSVSSTSSLPSGAQSGNQALLGLSRSDFLVWRRSHPGPKSKRAFRIWAQNGGKDLPHFKYKPPGGRRDGR
ncbi:uncharacterized protein LOC136077988 isoform X1 [Hydra vulgaris]|uniref:Uncharacterized protein LOC136077988 isoform X1 n=1 Tax=Hydra vulgaris TaxID=6087 RepID=A0ABM4BHT9_HYDVU